MCKDKKQIELEKKIVDAVVELLTYTECESFMVPIGEGESKTLIFAGPLKSVASLVVEAGRIK